MNPLIREWIEKAEGDFTTTRRELRARGSPNYDAACFHAQPVAEKYLKAVLLDHGQNIPKTHQLIDLLALCIGIDGSYELVYADLAVLDGYAVRFRYPGQSADKSEAKGAYRSAKAVRAFMRSKLGLE